MKQELNMEKLYTRWCDYCKNWFPTPQKFARVCNDCREYNHSKKVLSNLLPDKS